MKALKAIKKIAAAGLGFAFIGATIGGAMATDLGDYPAPFATESGYNGKIIVGEKASAIDIVGAVNIASSFTNLEGAGSVIVETPEGKVVNAVAFDELDGDGDPLPEDEMPMKNEYRKLNFDEDDVEWAFMQGYENDEITEDLNIVIQASVGSSDCEPDDEVIKIDRFIYTFVDTSDDLEKEIEDVKEDLKDGDTDVKFEYPIELFGKEYKVVDEGVHNDTVHTDGTPEFSDSIELQVANADETVQAGDEIDLAPYGYGGYTLKITRIVESASSSQDQSGTVFVALMKDGVQVDDATIDETEDATLEDEDEDIEVDIEVSSVYWDASNSEYFAEINFKAGVLKINDYFDENEMWKLESLTINPTTTEPAKQNLTITVTYDGPEDDLDCELEGNELYVGNTLSLLDYVELGFVGLTEPETAEVEIRIEEDKLRDEIKLVVEPKDDDVEVEFAGYKDKGSPIVFEYYTNATDTPAEDMVQGWKLKEFGNEYDEDEDPAVYLAYSVYNSTWTTDGNDSNPGQKDNSVKLYLDDDNEYKITVDLGITAGGADADPSAKDNVLKIEEPAIGGMNTDLYIVGLGATYWTNKDVVTNSSDDDSVVREGDKTDLGTEVVNYDYDDREATISIVSDAIRYLVYAGQNVESEGNEVELEVGDTAPAGAKVAAVGAQPLPVGLAILDSELSSPDAVKDDNYIVVGGPCANSAAAALMGIEDPATCDQAFADEGYSAGEAVIKLYEEDGNFQLLVAGYNGEDTLLATEVLASYDKFKDKFEGKSEVKVKGTALADVEIEG